MRTMHSVLRRVMQGIVMLVSVCLLVLAFVPRAMGYTPVSIADDSMEPLLRKGDFVFTRPIAFEDIQVGDLLTFADSKTGKRFTRTVSDIWTEKQQIVTTSPQSDEFDPYTTPYSCVVGKADKTIRFAGYPSVWLNTTLGKAILALLFIIWIAVEIEYFGASKRREDSCVNA